MEPPMVFGGPFIGFLIMSLIILACMWFVVLLNTLDPVSDELSGRLMIAIAALGSVISFLSTFTLLHYV